MDLRLPLAIFSLSILFACGCADSDTSASQTLAEDASLEVPVDGGATELDGAFYGGEKEDSESSGTDAAATPDDSSEPMDDAAEPEDAAESMEDAAEPMEDAAESMEDAAESMEDAAESMEDAAEPMEDVAEPMDDAAEPMDDAAEPMDDTAEPMDDAAEPEADTAEPEEDTGESEGGEGGPSTTNSCNPEGLWNVTVVSNAAPGEGCQGPEGNPAQSESLHIFALDADDNGNFTGTLIKPTPINANGISTFMTVENDALPAGVGPMGEEVFECRLTVHIESLVFVPASNPDQNDGSQQIAYDYILTYESAPLVIGAGMGTVHTEFQILEGEIEFPCTEAIAAAGLTAP